MPTSKYRRAFSQRIEVGLTAFLFVSIGVVFLLLYLFLSHSNSSATRGYTLNTLQQQRADLVQRNEILSMKVADLRTLEALEKDEIIQSMVPSEDPIFIRENGE